MSPPRTGVQSSCIPYTLLSVSVHHRLREHQWRYSESSFGLHQIDCIFQWKEGCQFKLQVSLRNGCFVLDPAGQMKWAKTNLDRFVFHVLGGSTELFRGQAIRCVALCTVWICGIRFATGNIMMGLWLIHPASLSVSPRTAPVDAYVIRRGLGV